MLLPSWRTFLDQWAASCKSGLEILCVRPISWNAAVLCIALWRIEGLSFNLWCSKTITRVRVVLTTGRYVDRHFSVGGSRERDLVVVMVGYIKGGLTAVHSTKGGGAGNISIVTLSLSTFSACCCRLNGRCNITISTCSCCSLASALCPTRPAHCCKLCISYQVIAIVQSCLLDRSVSGDWCHIDSTIWLMI